MLLCLLRKENRETDLIAFCFCEAKRFYKYTTIKLFCQKKRNLGKVRFSRKFIGMILQPKKNSSSIRTPKILAMS
jgi:hypothetical protein